MSAPQLLAPQVTTPGMARCDQAKTRIRIVNSGGFAIFEVSIAKHRLQVIAIDAVIVKPVWVSRGTPKGVQTWLRTPTGVNTTWIQAFASPQPVPQTTSGHNSQGRRCSHQQRPALRRGDLPH